MLKFAASRRTLPPNYLSKTNKTDWKGFDISKVTSMLRKRNKENSNSNGPIAASDNNNDICIPTNRDDGLRSATKRKALSDLGVGEPKKMNMENADEKGGLTRSLTVQMRVWSNQLNRIKKKTESLRKKV